MCARKETDDASSSFNLRIDIFAGIGGSQTDSESVRESKDSEAFWNIFFSPIGKFGLSFAVFFNENLETLLGVGTILSVKNSFNIGGNFWF